uniref:Uncharacterized protein n=1 Tax=Oryza punctata TaxID=4537 RepID=A0A0E0KZV8_ORYPU
MQTDELTDLAGRISQPGEAATGDDGGCQNLQLITPAMLTTNTFQSEARGVSEFPGSCLFSGYSFRDVSRGQKTRTAMGFGVSSALLSR